LPPAGGAPRFEKRIDLPFDQPILRKPASLTLAYCWLLCFLAFRFEQMTRELLANYVLAKGLGASVDGWRMSLFNLTILTKAFSLQDNTDVYLGSAKVLIALAIGIACLCLEPRLTTFTARLLALYWALWSLIAFLRPLLFSTFFARNPLAGLWPGLPLGQGLRQALGTLLLLLALGFVLGIFHRGIVLGTLRSPVGAFPARTMAAFCLFCVPLLAATILALFRLPYFHLSEAWPYLVLALVFLVIFSLMPAIWRVEGRGTATVPTRAEIARIVSLALLLLAAIPISRQLERITNEHRLASYRSRHLWISYPSATVPESSVISFSAAAESIYSRIASKIHLSELSSRIHFIFFSSAEEKLSRNDSAEVADFELPQNEIRLIFIPPFDHFDPAVLARFLLQKRFGSGRNPILEAGLACLLTSEADRHAGPTERGNGTEEELASVLEVEGPLSLHELLFPANPDSLSPFVSRPLGRELASFLQSRHGLDKLLALYSKKLTVQTADTDIVDALATSGSQLQTDWQQHCIRRRDEFLRRIGENSPKPGRRRAQTPILFQKGMSFSAEGGARTGYMSEAACASLDQLRQLHVEWLSLMPFAFSSWGNGQPRLSFSHRNSWEGDDNLQKISWEAHRRGMKIFLKPHLWLRGQSTVDLEISDPAAWHDWFSSYRRYILHQARLGEAIGAELFSIGNELPLLTLDAAHQTDWRTLISEVQRVFSGNITYCANWGEDFEKIRFADALDVVGLNAYYPLTGQPEASPEEWREGARAVADKVGAVAARIQRPIIITEIGYPSTAQAALRPWTEDGSRLSVKAQAEAASAFFEAFWDRPWLRGIYWWKWYSHGRGGGENDASYMPRGKPAAAAIAEWYSRPRE
jgi:hypothetical protein